MNTRKDAAFTQIVMRRFKARQRRMQLARTELAAALELFPRDERPSGVMDDNSERVAAWLQAEQGAFQSAWPRWMPLTVHMQAAPRRDFLMLLIQRRSSTENTCNFASCAFR